MKLIIDHICISIDRIHEQLRIYKDIDTGQRYIELVDHESEEFRYYPIHHFTSENFSVDFSQYLTQSDFQRVCKIGGELYELETMKRINRNGR